MATTNTTEEAPRGYQWYWPEEAVGFGPFTYAEAMEFARQEVGNSYIGDEEATHLTQAEILEMTDEALQVEMAEADWVLGEFTVITPQDLAAGREMLGWPEVEA
jgi:hypothetical protein